MTMEELKPCPFCGGKAWLLVNDGVKAWADMPKYKGGDIDA